MAIGDIVGGLGAYLHIIRIVAIVIIVFAIFSILIAIVRKRLLDKVKTKKQRSNVEIFSKILRYTFFIFLIMFTLSTYTNAWAGLSLGIGLFSAALGWALQKPITGIAAWIMIVARRPFEIGDRIIVGNVSGDVADVTLTHIYLNEIGGIVSGQENSGRTIMVPNSIMFEQNIINYTSKDEYILDQVVLNVTYESDLDKAMEIVLKAAKKHTEDFIRHTNQEPYVRTFFQPSGINVHVRYMADAKRLQEFSSIITKEIFDMTKKEKNVEIAYPHTKVIMSK